MNHQRKKFGIIKVGTEVVTNPETGLLNERAIKRIVKQIAQLREELGQVCIVTSGAIAAGRAELNGLLDIRRKDETPEDLQLYSTSGQPRLHATYEKYLRRRGLHGIQALLTKADFTRDKFQNLFRRALRDPQIIPVVNENDALTDQEICYSDNDELAADVAIEFGANRLIVLSKTNGLLKDLNDPKSRIPIVSFGDKTYEQYIEDSKSGNGRGGMKAKCESIVRTTEHGIEGGIINGVQPSMFYSSQSLINFVRREIDKRPGTTFLPS